jgi:hypothetical protein
MKKLLSLLFVLALGIQLHAANTTSLVGPGSPGGRPSQDVATLGRIDNVNQREIGDCSDGAVFSATTNTSVVFNPATVTGLSWAANSYAGNYTLYVVNTGNTDLVLWGSLTTTPIVATYPAGTYVKAGTGGLLRIQSRAGLVFHAASLTGTGGAGNYSICTD